MGFAMSRMGIGAPGRAELPWGDSGALARMKVYGQLDAGLGIGQTELRDQSDMATRHTHFGPAFALGAGVLVGGDDHNLFARGLGVSFGYQLEYAPVIDNLV